MLASSYGWAALALAILAILAVAIWWLRQQQLREIARARAEDLARANEVVADANRAAANALGRDLGSAPGLELRERDKPTGSL